MLTSVEALGVASGTRWAECPSVPRPKAAVRPHLVLVVHIADLTASSKSKRRGNAGQHRNRQRPAQPTEKASLADADLQSRGDEIGDGGEPRSNSSHAAAEPADRSRQCHFRPANQIGGGFHALG